MGNYRLKYIKNNKNNHTSALFDLLIFIMVMMMIEEDKLANEFNVD